MFENRRSKITSTLARLLKPRNALSVEQSARSRTFQGRPVVKMMWKGEEVEAVQGLVAYCVRDPKAIRSKESISLPNASAPDELGIGVMDVGGSPVNESIDAATRSLRQDLAWTEPVLIDRGALRPNDLSFPQQWGLAHINAERGWDLWNGDPNRVVLAILDSGISMQAGRLSHPDLFDESRFFLGRDLVNQDLEPRDDHGHGTHIAGIAAATKNNQVGVAGLWPGSVLVLKVFNDVNLESSNVVFERAVTEAVSFAQQRGARLIINYSGGGPTSDSKTAAIRHASNNNALVVAAAGNDDGARIISPASLSTTFSNVIAVGAIGEDHMRPPFANRGTQMSVVAPGVSIFSTLPNYIVTANTALGKETKFDLLSGTSQATALVSALAALVWSKSPQLTAEEVRARIANTSTTISGSRNDFGSGIINVEAALS
jgi:subtilisin family serine protease